LQTDQGDFGIKRSGGEKSPRIFLKTRIEGGGDGGDVPDDGLREKLNNLAMAGTLGKPGKSSRRCGTTQNTATSVGKGETVEERVASAEWLTSPNIPSCSTPYG